jgi:hypothetical protein
MKQIFLIIKGGGFDESCLLYLVYATQWNVFCKQSKSIPFINMETAF